jgi:glucose/mannose-6-phosphate isomerase
MLQESIGRLSHEQAGGGGEMKGKIEEEKYDLQRIGALDDGEHIRAVDSHSLLSLISGFAEQLERAIGFEIPDISETNDTIRAVGIVGVCTTVVCALALSALVDRSGKGCVYRFNRFTLPKWLGRDVLLVFISFSGNTQEVLCCFEEAMSRRLPSLVVTSGGMLQKRAQEEGIPIVSIPKESPPNRTVFPYLFVPVLRTACRLGLLDINDREITQAALSLEQKKKGLEPSVPAAKNRAKRIAIECEGLIPLIYTENQLLIPVIRRWQYDFNENAKLLSHSAYIPEMSHNEIIGLQGEEGKLCGIPLFLTARKGESDAVGRLDFTIEALRNAGFRPLEIGIEGATDLQTLLYGILLGDYTSVYLAVLKGVDPHSVDLIDSIRIKDNR